MAKRVRDSSVTIIFRNDADHNADLLVYEIDRNSELTLIDSAIEHRA